MSTPVPPQGRTADKVEQNGVNGYPTIYVLDRKGIIRSATSGEVPYQQLAAAVAAASQR